MEPILSQVKKRDGSLEIVIVEIKLGTTHLSPAQFALAKAVETGRVRFEMVGIFDDGTIQKREWKSRYYVDSPNIAS